MGVDLTAVKARVFTTITRAVKYTEHHVVVLLALGPPDRDEQYVRLATVRTGWKLSEPRNPATGVRQARLTIAETGAEYAQPAGQPAQGLGQLIARASAFDLVDTRPGGEWLRYTKAEGHNKPRTATKVWRMDVEPSATDTTPYVEPVPRV